MNILAFDCCFGAVSTAVRWQSGEGQWEQRESYELHASGNAERLFPMIAEVLASAGLRLAEMDRIAVTLGPGTFTGVRVGVAAARAFAIAAGKPVVGTSSLAVMAHRARRLPEGQLQSGPIPVAVDARRGMVYLQAFGVDQKPASEALLATPAEAARVIEAKLPGENPIRVVGSGAAAVVQSLRANGRRASAYLPDLLPDAGSLTDLAENLAPLLRVAPIYLRQPDARPQTGPSLRAERP
jgi:tRNA threonylcarbamoyladenosine biosynthesis protein TsaB